MTPRRLPSDKIMMEEKADLSMTPRRPSDEIMMEEKADSSTTEEAI